MWYIFKSFSVLISFKHRNGLRLIFVGGKGGVGKTTTTAALGVKMADAGLKTLVVSTDPAHSLGDALFMTSMEGDLRGKGSLPTSVAGCNELLDALEIDPEQSVQSFKDALGAFDLAGAAREVGGQAGADFVDKLGLSAFVRLLESPPPGVDELVALQEVLKLSRQGKYDRVLIDTAPTGHTLRLLGAPDFLDSFLGKLGALRSKLDGVLGMGAGLLGLDVSALTAKLDAATAALEGYRQGAVELKALFRDPASTEFIAVASPTPLAVAETRRLIGSLRKEGIGVRHLVVNKVLMPSKKASDSNDDGDENGGAIGGGGSGGGGSGGSDGSMVVASDDALIASMRRGQASAVEVLTKSPTLLVSSSPPTTLSEEDEAASSSGGSGSGIALTQVPLFDADISGVSGLRYLGAVAFQGRFESVDLLPPTVSSTSGVGSSSSSSRSSGGGGGGGVWDDLLTECTDQRFVVVGGKGGVGKTSISSALAVACTEQVC